MTGFSKKREVNVNRNITITTFDKFETAIRSVRDTVFGKEQSVPHDIDWDGQDQNCMHVVAFDKVEHPIGTGRIRSDGKIGRLAVLKQYRGTGVGGALLEALIESARQSGLKRVFLHAQTQALAFYQQYSFKAEGDLFFEADIEHIKMTRDL